MKKIVLLIACVVLSLSCSSDDDTQTTVTATCNRPANFQSSDIGFDRFTVTWTQTGAESFIVEYGETGFTLGSGTEKPVIFEITEISGLSSATTYDVYVRGLCPDGLVSDNAGPIQVMTRDE